MNTETSTLIDSDFPLIDIGKEYTFVSDLPESITSQFDNSYIDKTLTGCGFTTWILQNNDSFIIASPYKGLIDCKVEQSNNDTTGFYPYKVFPFYYDENNKHQKDDLSFYITQQEKQNHPIKIMVTYDSVPRVLRYLDELKYDIKQTKLFVDECHKVLEFAGKIESNLNIPDLSPADKLKLGKIPNFAKLVKEYAEAVFKRSRSIALPNTDEWYDAHEIAKAIEENPAYTDIVDYVKEYGFESALSYSEKSSTLSSAGVKRKLEKAKGKSIIKEILEREITPGITLTYAQVNELLKNIYDKHGITDKPKKSHIDFAFKTVKSTILENGKQISVIRIKDKIN